MMQNHAPVIDSKLTDHVVFGKQIDLSLTMPLTDEIVSFTQSYEANGLLTEQAEAFHRLFERV